MGTDVRLASDLHRILWEDCVPMQARWREKSRGGDEAGAIDFVRQTLVVSGISGMNSSSENSEGNDDQLYLLRVALRDLAHVSQDAIVLWPLASSSWTGGAR